MRAIKGLKSIIDKFIPPHLKETPYIYEKAKVVTYIHFFIFTVVFALGITSLFLGHGNSAPLFGGCIMVAIFIYVFKRWGNLVLAGNLLATATVLTIIPSVFETGGLYSDNLLWLIIAPLFALLFGNRRSGFVWSFLLLGFTIYTFILALENELSFRDQTGQFDSSYYFVSYFTLFIAVIAIVIIFKTGQGAIINLLEKNQKMLREQKQELIKNAEILKKTEEKLRISNQELEHFAYAASHDLKEPLRMIHQYTQLINKRLTGNLDNVSGEYMYFVMDGVTRMQRLLDDLLEYSRLGRSQNKKNTDLNNILMIVMSNLMMAMQDSGASIYANHLPTIYASSSEMIQLFQNIISNGIKFRKSGTNPAIRIKVEEKEDQYLISIADNGIGIPQEHQNRVFAIFERLHSKSEYEGTGIGLSTCKKIVNNLGGEIWLQSHPGEGTTFFFTLPKSQVPEATPSQASMTS